MQALRLARPRVALTTAHIARRSIAAAASSSHAGAPSTSSPASAVPLSNVEAQWERLSVEEQAAVHQQLEEIQKRDWKTLSLDEKKAAYYVAFGPHGPRKPVTPPGGNMKAFVGVMGLLGVAGAIFAAIRSFAPPPPKTINKEWEEAMNQRAIEQKLDPISGIASEGYKGKGFVTHK